MAKQLLLLLSIIFLITIQSIAISTKPTQTHKRLDDDEDSDSYESSPESSSQKSSKAVAIQVIKSSLHVNKSSIEKLGTFQ